MTEAVPCALAVAAWKGAKNPARGTRTSRNEAEDSAAVSENGHQGSKERRKIAGVLAAARKAYDFAERKSVALTPGLSSDPTWLMMLDLFISHAEGARLSVTDLCIGSRASFATALRYLALLEKAGYATRIADPTDRRRSYVGMTDHGACTVIGLLS